MSYLVYARKYRPKTFDEMVGQKAVVRTLANAIRSDRVAQAYLFSGMRGVGKTTAARILAKALNCREGPTPTPCNKCDNCVEINEDRSMDVIEIDGASNNKVDEIRPLREGVQYKPINCRYKVIIIDEIHMLSSAAFNALLKTLEEPPPNTIFIFATTEFHKVPATIVSRCQHFEFKRITLADTTAHLQALAEKEGVRISSRGLRQIAEAAEGSLRDAQSLLDQAVAFSGEKIDDEDLADILGTINREILFRFSSAVLEGRPDRIFELVESIIDGGHDLRFFHEELIRHFRNLLLVRTVKETRDILPYTGEELKNYRKEAAKAAADELLRCLDGLQKGEEGLRFSSHPRIFLEAMLIKLCHFRELVPLTEIIRRVESAGTAAAAPAADVENSAGKTNPSSSDGARRPPPRSEPETTRALDPRITVNSRPSDAAGGRIPSPNPGKGKKTDSFQEDGRRTKPERNQAPADPKRSRSKSDEETRKDPEVQTFLDSFKARIISVEDKPRENTSAGTKSKGGQS